MKHLILISLCVFSHALGSTCWGGIWNKKTSIGGTGRHRGIGGNAYQFGYMGLGHVNGAGADISFRDWWQYNPATDSWTQKSDFPVANHGAVCFNLNDRVYVGGGSSLTNEFYAFNPLLNQWTPIANCPLSPGDVQGFSAGNKGYVIYTNQLAEYNPNTDSWSLKANVPINASNWSCTFSNGTSGFLKVGHSLLEYKPSQDLWIARANHPGLSTGGSYGFSINGIGYIASGYVGGLSTVTEEVWSFNPANNSWTREADLPGSSRRFFASFSIAEKGYIGLGTNGINLNDVWEYDPSQTLNTADNKPIDISLYPNPCSKELKINGIYDQLEYSIYSYTGEKVLGGETSGRIDVDHLPQGTYFILINNIKYVFTKV